MLTSWWAKAFDPLRPFIEPTGFGSFIEPLSSSNRAKSIGVVQRGVEVHDDAGSVGGGGVGGNAGGSQVTDKLLQWLIASWTHPDLGSPGR